MADWSLPHNYDDLSNAQDALLNRINGLGRNFIRSKASIPRFTKPDPLGVLEGRKNAIHRLAQTTYSFPIAEHPPLGLSTYDPRNWCLEDNPIIADNLLVSDLKQMDMAVRDFEAGVHISEMSLLTRTALVEVVAQGMMKPENCDFDWGIMHIINYLEEYYRKIMVDPSRHMEPGPERRHWLLGNLFGLRTPELQWLLNHGKHRQDVLIRRAQREQTQRRPFEREIDALFDEFIDQSLLISESKGGVFPA